MDIQKFEELLAYMINDARIEVNRKLPDLSKELVDEFLAVITHDIATACKMMLAIKSSWNPNTDLTWGQTFKHCINAINVAEDGKTEDRLIAAITKIDPRLVNL